MPPGRPGPGTTQGLVPGLASSRRLAVATGGEVLVVDAGRGTMSRSRGLEGHLPTCLAAGSAGSDPLWCGTDRHGVHRSDDGGATWRAAGLEGRRIMSLAVSPSEAGVVWAGTEPSQLWRSGDGGATWDLAPEMEALPSSSEWAFPPRPDTHHVRWIACHPREPGTLWVAVEAGALLTTRDGGRTWRDRVQGGPYDTHELAVHPSLPETLRVSAGDGYYESDDGGATWSSPAEGLDVGYLRSVAIDPGRADIVVVSGASGPRSAYVAGRSDGRVYRREGDGPWQRVVDGWPERPETIAPLLAAGAADGELWAADERGIHRSGDGGARWTPVAEFEDRPRNLRGLVVVGG